MKPTLQWEDGRCTNPPEGATTKVKAWEHFGRSQKMRSAAAEAELARVRKLYLNAGTSLEVYRETNANLRAAVERQNAEESRLRDLVRAAYHEGACEGPAGNREDWWQASRTRQKLELPKCP